MRKMTRLVIVALAMAVVSPLVSSPATSIAGGKPKFMNLNKAPKTKISGKDILEGLEEYVRKFPLRQNGLPGNTGAADFLAKEATKYGFKSTIREFQVKQANAIPRTVRVVESIKKGTKKPNEWIALVAHYDAVAPDGVGLTVEGAYDPASGANMLRFFGKAFSKIKTKRSIALIWFDAEENGLLASKPYAEYVYKRGQKIQMVMGFDMVGIGYPARYCTCVWHGPNPGNPELVVPLNEHVNHKFLKFPKNNLPSGQQRFPTGGEPHFCNCGISSRNSDESSFVRIGGKPAYHTLRWSGMRAALDYPGYHMPWDNVPFMEQVAGGRELLEGGMLNTFKSAYYSTLVLDNLK